MKKIIVSLIIIFGIAGVASASWYNPLSWFGNEINNEIKLGRTVSYPYTGGTGTSTAPTYGQMLVGNSGGTYTLTATSSLGITATGDGPGTVSTSTTPTIGNLSYWTSTAFPSLLGTVATGTISASGGITATAGQSIIGSGLTVGCTAASGSQAGCLASADWTTFNNKQSTISATWPIALSGATLSFDGLSTSTAAVLGNIPYFSGVNTFANVATSTFGAGTGLSFSGTAGYQVGGTNGTFSVNTSQNIATLSNLTSNGFVKTGGGVGTLSVDTSTYLTTVDISANTNLAATYPVLLTGDTLSLAFGTTTSNTWASTQTFSAIAGTIDAGGATSFEIPNGTAPATDAAGEVAVDTTSGQFKWYDGVRTQIVTGTTTMAFNIASTTLDAMGKSFSSGTTTLLLKNSAEPFTLNGFYCVASSTGTALVRFGDGTNWTTAGACTTGSYTTTSSNNTFTSFEDFILQASSTAGAVSRITITTVINKTAD